MVPDGSAFIDELCCLPFHLGFPSRRGHWRQGFQGCIGVWVKRLGGGSDRFSAVFVELLSE